MIKSVNHLLNKYLLNAHHLLGIMTSVTTALNDARNIGFRMKNGGYSTLGVITDSFVV